LSRPTVTPSETPAGRLESSFAACALSFSPWWANRKGLSREQRTRAAHILGARRIEGGGVKIANPKHVAIKAMSTLRGAARKYWEGKSLPYPQDGLRLIKRAELAEIRTTLEGFQMQAEPAAEALNEARAELVDWGRENNGELFDRADFPRDFRTEYQMQFSFPSVHAPEYLRELDPEAFERERALAMARFEEAVSLAEQAFSEEFAKLVSHLTERLTARGDDGRPVVFRDSAIGNLREFFERFRSLNIHSSPEMDELIDQARGALDGVAPGDLRDSSALRQQVARQLEQVSGTLDGMLQSQPRRAIQRPPRSAPADPAPEPTTPPEPAAAAPPDDSLF